MQNHRSAFVGMSFRRSVLRDPVYRAIKSACESAGFCAYRVDEEATSRGIVDRVRAAILRADCCIFDLTDERPNVYYEIGLADGLLLDPDRVLFLARTGTKVHLDVHHRPYVRYKNPQTLQVELGTCLSRLGGPDLLDVGPSSRAARTILSSCRTLSESNNDFRKYISRAMLDRFAVSLEELTRHRAFHSPDAFVNAVEGRLKARSTIRARAVCGGKTWAPALVTRYYNANYRLARRACRWGNRRSVNVERVFIEPEGGLRPDVRRVFDEHVKLSRNADYSIRAHVVDWENLPDRRLIPRVYQDLVEDGFGFIAITTRKDGIDQTTVFAHVGGGEGKPFLGAQFGDPGVVVEMLGLFANLALNRSPRDRR